MNERKRLICDRCDDDPLIYLGGQILLCWKHYCEEMNGPPLILQRVEASDAAK